MKVYLNIEKTEIILKCLALYNALVGLILIFFPTLMIHLLSLEAPDHTGLCSVLGVVFLVFAGGLYLSSFGPEDHWVIILGDFLIRFFTSFILLNSFLSSSLSLQAFILMGLNNILWAIILSLVLLFIYDAKTTEESEPKKFHDLIKFVRTSNGETLYDFSEHHHLLLVFVRHFGCTFCRETVSEIAKLEDSIKQRKLTPVYIHMSDPGFAEEFFARYYTHPVAHVSDPGRLLYKSLNLRRGSFYQVFGPMTLLRGLWLGFFKGHGIGSREGDVLQLGGVFILSKGHITFEYKSPSASDIFDQDLLPHI